MAAVTRYEINIQVERGLNQPPQPTWLRRVTREALAATGVAPPAELGLVVAGDETVQDLNRRYRGMDATTDVLAFSLQETASAEGFVPPPDGTLHLGEVIISHPQARLQAAEQGHSLEREVAILIIHGILHLLGYDHETSGQEPKMRAREREILGLVERKGLLR
ncbi:MAG TPA: rRNA maturation RNase YbeY [Dehalococcoidia bacterium]|jgi:probable rRNA maturation factor|nr:rRNA maturation RNase YbeY [Dehalococcoidia bacterium]